MATLSRASSLSTSSPRAAPASRSSSTPNWLACDLILYHGSEAQKDKYLPQAAQGKIFAFGLTESSAGSDAAGIKSTCTPAEDGGWILNGGKAWITNSGVADYYIILAKTDPEAGNKGISAFIVPKDAEGLTVGKFEDKMGMRGSATCELSFDNIHLPADALLGSTGMASRWPCRPSTARASPSAPLPPASPSTP